MARIYAQIQNSLTSSKKIRRLSSDSSKWAYLAAHLSDLGNYAGLFCYPKTIWAYDVMKSPDQMDDIIKDLIRVNLVEYDFDEEVVRIVAWFDKKNAPDSANRMIGLMKDYSVLDVNNSGLVCRSIAEFFGCITTSRLRHWKAGESEKLEHALRMFWSDMDSDFGSEFEQTILEYVKNSQNGKNTEVLSLVGIKPP